MRLKHIVPLAALLLAACAEDRARPLALRAKADYAHGRLTQAVVEYQSLAQRYPRNPRIWTRLGNCEALLGRIPEAERAYGHALRLRPQSSAIRYNFAMLELHDAQQQMAIVAHLSPSGPLGLRAQRLGAALAKLPYLSRQSASRNGGKS